MTHGPDPVPDDYGTIAPSDGETSAGQSDGYPTSGDYSSDSNPNSTDK